VCGSELFTGNTAVVTAAVYEGKATFGQLLKSWSASYLGNILGCAFGVFLLLNSGLAPTLANGINAISVVKVSHPLKEVPAGGAGAGPLGRGWWCAGFGGEGGGAGPVMGGGKGEQEVAQQGARMP
jgi:formate/nitrite transporter FocA (FNT family)